jgi:hypothetical protein
MVLLSESTKRKTLAGAVLSPFWATENPPFVGLHTAGCPATLLERPRSVMSAPG